MHIVSKTDLAVSWPAKEYLKKQTNVRGATPVCALCDSQSRRFLGDFFTRSFAGDEMQRVWQQ